MSEEIGKRDIDLIIEGVKKRLPSAAVRQHWVKNPDVDDDGVWCFFLPGFQKNIQIESSHGTCPFLVEHDDMKSSLEAELVQSTSEAVETIVEYLTSLLN